MSKTVTAVLLGTLLALIAATVGVPYQDITATTQRIDEQREWEYPAWRAFGYDRVWRTALTPDPSPGGISSGYGLHWSDRVLHWPVLLAEQALILLLGGGLLTFVVRRERRRKAMA